MPRHSRTSLDYDPLTAAIAPPSDETPEQRAKREQDEAEAQRVSDLIDEQLKAERAALKKKKPPIKVLLLGQSESGKSTTVKNFQLAYAHNAWLEERASWRSVILLNLVRSVNTILDILGKEMHYVSSPPPSSNLRLPPTSPTSSQTSDEDDDDEEDEPERNLPAPLPRRPGSASPPATQQDIALYQMQMRTRNTRFLFTEKHRLLQMRLKPLRRVQRDLEQLLGAPSFVEADDLRGPATPFASMEGSSPSSTVSSRKRMSQSHEFVVRSRNGWKGALRLGGDEDERERGERGKGGKRGRDERSEETMGVISGCGEDIRALWADPIVQEVLAKRGVKMEDQPGFFLDEVDRIATRDYEPSDDDVVKARLRTTGVQEYHFLFEKGSEAGREWIMYDVGGARSYRSAWYPYFMDVNAIIFLAPISVFDEPLAEDRKVNRLEDSFLLWKAVCSSRLLSKVQLILFLNKCDLLQRKLKRGSQLRQYIPTYGDRPNDLANVAKYFRQQFREMSRRYSPEQRSFYSFLTSVVDVKSTAVTLGTVREGILRNHLANAELI
ncbi:G-alpha-domain-containing protein [Stereum hirsutum FP-91666 SS1]|uniref:G-alpha-domain-containing protein n=1 Tax=Stereum hirsutum (strain FP-91666) TaxID=721885 RepID=R7RX59_STEHR|nr:G-alpha-domain-containing protein [Stereum hirsutum FP-91666 SS1]EIM79929.1 G-alpha-domain-containing protein [Stereum hirsutum FP-91666 SS1]